VLDPVARRRSAVRRPRRLATTLALATLVTVAGAPATASAQSGPCGRVVAVGDSVMAGASQSLQRRGVVVDARVSRQFSAGAPIAEWAARDARAVVVHLGTNGPMSYQQLDRLATAVTSRGARLVLVTVQLPGQTRYAYESTVNGRIWGVWQKRWGVKVADWNWLSGANRNLLAGDGIHLNGSAGAKAFADLVVSVACGR
jgi:hypothetical protein